MCVCTYVCVWFRNIQLVWQTINYCLLHPVGEAVLVGNIIIFRRVDGQGTRPTGCSQTSYACQPEVQHNCNVCWWHRHPKPITSRYCSFRYNFGSMTNSTWSDLPWLFIISLILFLLICAFGHVSCNSPPHQELRNQQGSAVTPCLCYKWICVCLAK